MDALRPGSGQARLVLQVVLRSPRAVKAVPAGKWPAEMDTLNTQSQDLVPPSTKASPVGSGPCTHRILRVVRALGTDSTLPSKEPGSSFSPGTPLTEHAS